jgi:alpha-ketoglutarate-dependent taurine dioxygenase
MNSPFDISVQRITGNIGAVIGGADLRDVPPDSQIATIRQALLDHGVVFFRGQHLTAEQYWAFMERFGVPQKEESSGTDKDTAADVMTGDMSVTRKGTAVWHADTTSLAKPPIVTALRAVEVPPFGGDTCWSSMYAAWDALSEPMRRLLDGLTAVHAVDATIERMEEFGAKFEASYTARNARQNVHPVVLIHPESGRKALYVNESFTTRIVELDRLESRAVLDFLFRHVERPDFIMRWKWEPGDIAFWDNRGVQHYAVPDYTATRRMQRIVIAGVKPGEPSVLRPREHATSKSG